MELTFSALCQREVIRVCDAVSLGCVSDVLFESCSGKICALYVSPAASVKRILCGEVYVIPFSAVRCIGDTVILADVGCDLCCEKRRRL